MDDCYGARPSRRWRAAAVPPPRLLATLLLEVFHQARSDTYGGGIMKVLAASLAIASVATPVLGQITGVTKQEHECESGAGAAFAKFIARQSRCVQTCIATARPPSGPYADCYLPYGGATATCVDDPALGAAAKAAATIVRKCAAGCPDCYGAMVCATGDPFVPNVESAINLLASAVYCTETLGGTPTRAEARCEDVVSRTLVKFGAAKMRAYTDCFARAFVGKISTDDCFPPEPNDAKTAARIMKAEAKAVAAIDASCSAGNANPACYTNVVGLDTGAEWVGAVEGQLD